MTSSNVNDKNYYDIFFKKFIVAIFCKLYFVSIDFITFIMSIIFFIFVKINL